MANERNFWLKMVGAADKEVGANWIERWPKLLTEIRFPKRPSGIKRDDRLVYYAAGDQKLFAIARAVGDGADAEIVGAKGEGRWPYVLKIQMMLAVPLLPFAADWTVLGLSPGTVQQKSYVGITPDKYRIAQQAIFERTAIA